MDALNKEKAGEEYIASKVAEIKRDKIQDQAAAISSLTFKPEAKNEFKPNAFFDFINKADNLSESQSDSAFATIYKKVRGFFSELWDANSNASYVFWIVWLFALAAVGAAAVGTAAVSAIVVGITAAIIAPFIIVGVIVPAIVKWVLRLTGPAPEVLEAKLTELKNSELSEAEKDQRVALLTKYVELLTETQQGQLAQYKAERSRQEHSARARLFMRAEFKGFKDVLNKDGNNIWLKWKGSEARVKPLKSLSTEGKSEVKEIGLQDIENVRQSELGKHLLGNRYARTVIAGIRGFVGGAAGLIFILWLIGTGVGALAAFTGLGFLASIAGFLGGAGAAGIILPAVSGLVGGLFGIRAAAAVHTQQLSHEERVTKVLLSTYKDTKLSRMEVFNQLLAQAKQLEKNLGDNPKAAKLLKEMGYRGAEKTVYNDRYFEKFQHDETLWTKIKKFGNRLHAAVMGAETGMFAGRYLFLAGAIAAGIFTLAIVTVLTGGATLIPFLILTGIIAVAYGSLSVCVTNWVAIKNTEKSLLIRLMSVLLVWKNQLMY